MSSSCTGLAQQGTQKLGGVRVGNGPTEDEAGIMDHDQLSQHSEEGDEVSHTKRCLATQHHTSRPVVYSLQILKFNLIQQCLGTLICKCCRISKDNR